MLCGIHEALWKSCREIDLVFLHVFHSEQNVKQFRIAEASKVLKQDLRSYKWLLLSKISALFTPLAYSAADFTVTPGSIPDFAFRRELSGSSRSFLAYNLSQNQLGT